MKSFSTGQSSIPPSATLAVNDKAKALKAAGHDVISLAGGDPDFDTPPHIIQAAFDAIKAAPLITPRPRSAPCLREAIAAKMERENGVDSPDRPSDNRHRRQVA